MGNCNSDNALPPSKSKKQNPEISKKNSGNEDEGEDNLSKNSFENVSENDNDNEDENETKKNESPERSNQREDENGSVFYEKDPDRPDLPKRNPRNKQIDRINELFNKE